jgi:hypothetical protein
MDDECDDDGPWTMDDDDDDGSWMMMMGHG